MRLEERKQLPALARALDYCNLVIQPKSFLKVILDSEQEGFPTGVRELDSTLSRLFRAFEPAQLGEQLRALFGSESEWHKAESEIFALTHLADLGQLTAVGWPNGYGDTPPFDGLSIIENLEIPFDIKSAKGSASQWLRDVLKPIAENWAAGRWPIAIETQISGTMTRQRIAPYRNDLVKDFRRKLGDHQVLPAKNIVLTAGATRIRVDIVRHGVTFSRRISSPADHAASVEETMREHVEQKARMATINNTCGFFLLYVRPPSSGTADMHPASFLKAANHLAQSCDSIAHFQMWLASVMLDWTPTDQQKIHIVCNPKAKWPPPLNEDSFCKCLSNTLHTGI